MNLSEIPKKIGNVWVLLAIAVAVLIFLVSPWGLQFRAWLLGNPCEPGMVWSQVNKTCMQATTATTCSSGMYLSFTPEKGYTCEWANLSILGVLGAVGLIVYFYLKGRKESGWVPARDAFDRAMRGGHLKFPKNCPAGTSPTDVYATITSINRIDPKGAWSFTGWFYSWGKLDTVLINATTNPGWVENSIDYPVGFGATNVQKLSKKGQEPLEVLKDAAKIRSEFEQKKEEVEEND